MLILATIMGAIAVALAWPVPVALSRARWPSQHPALGMMAWQAVALVGGVTMIGAGFAFGVWPLVEPELRSQLWLVTLTHFALAFSTFLGLHLILTLVMTWYRISRQRLRHRNLLSLLSEPSDLAPNALVIPHDSPVAYCVPGSGQSFTVLSRGLIAHLSDREIKAVIAHERAHLTQRHDLLILAFESWHRSLPWLPTARLARAAVSELIEMLADDAALRVVSKTDLLRALAATLQFSGEQGSVEYDAAADVKKSTFGHPASAERDDAGLPTEVVNSRRLTRLLDAA
ncbi:M56 family metallopeptidase [Neomicrococcus aestuarii]|uniref:Peptidase M48 domain-containing protein n=1 Tax=Neomicrococcus aestuarii TaxID=556325 RepID=A0A1L2ZK48_9MICC|nr:M56 family metallopeptidase [Neomicrococcus aestuarii]APF39765.1 hypothetical protein BHE16_00595 [Neomicrococcus aestuarii]